MISHTNVFVFGYLKNENSNSSLFSGNMLKKYGKRNQVAYHLQKKLEFCAYFFLRLLCIGKQHSKRKIKSNFSFLENMHFWLSSSIYSMRRSKIFEQTVQNWLNYTEKWSYWRFFSIFREISSQTRICFHLCVIMPKKWRSIVCSYFWFVHKQKNS